jgi:CHAT domain
MVAPHNGGRLDRLVVTFSEATPYEVRFAVLDAQGARKDSSGPHPLGPPPPVTLGEVKEDEAAAMGAALLTWFAGDEGGGCRRIWQETVRADTVADVVLDIRHPDLQCLPWEVLRDDPWSFLSSTRPPVRRRNRLPTDAPTVVAEQSVVPQRILVVQTGPVPVEADVLGAVHRGLRVRPCIWRVDLLDAPTLREFLARIHQFEPHVLHVVGHGAADAETQSVTVQPHDHSEPWKLDGAVVMAKFRETGLRSPRIVVLSCGTRDGDSHDLDDGLLASGAAAVVSMQGQVGVRASDLFAEGLYRYLAEDMAIHEAVARARNDVDTERTYGADFLRPRLTVATEPRELRLGLGPLHSRDLLLKTNFQRAHVLTDQSTVRGAIIDSLLGQVPVTVVSGGARCGKSKIVQSCIVAARTSGRRIVYLELPDPARKYSAQALIDDIESFVRDLRGPTAADARTRPPGPPRERSPVAGILDQVKGGLNVPARRLSVSASTYVDLRERLLEISTHGPFCVVFDGTSQIYDFATFRQEVVEAVRASGGDSQIQLVLVGPAARDADLDSLENQAGVKWIDVEEHYWHQTAELANEMIAKDWPFEPERSVAEKWKVCRDGFLNWARSQAQDGRGTLAIETLVHEYVRRRTDAGLPPTLQPFPTGR